MKARGHGIIDDIDLRILAVLQQNARASLSSIGEKARLSAPATLRRIQRLEKSGVIRGYYAALDGPKLGIEAQCFVSVSLKVQTDIAIKNFQEAARSNRHVRECYSVSGNRDFLMNCFFRDQGEQSRFMREFIGELANVDRVAVFDCKAVCKRETDIPARGG